MTNENSAKTYDLEERTAKFGEDIIRFARKIPKDPVTIPLIGQLVRSGTSVGANYCEADDAESKKDFIHKLGVSRKEAKETMHWFCMIAKAAPKCSNESRLLWKEAQELVFIFSSIIKKSRE